MSAQNDEAALLWIGATDDGWAPWLAPGGRCDGGAVPAEDARTEPPPDFDPALATGTAITSAMAGKPASARLHFFPSARLTLGGEEIAIGNVTMHERGAR